jgi:hypothetical protein
MAAGKYFKFKIVAAAVRRVFSTCAVGQMIPSRQSRRALRFLPIE